MSIIQGTLIEARAKQYLQSQGLSFVAANYRSRFGEIDLIMQDQDLLVFVEVRSRCSENYGGALASITRAKQRRITKTALCYLSQKDLLYKVPVRFDVLATQGIDATFDWLKNVFH